MGDTARGVGDTPKGIGDGLWGVGLVVYGPLGECRLRGVGLSQLVVWGPVGCVGVSES